VTLETHSKEHIMASNHQTLKIQVPALPPVPPHAARIGEFAADVLALAHATLKATGRALSSLGPREIRAELRQSASDVEAQRPAVTVSLRSVAAKGWIY
jgi:hypothetical protein